MTDLLDKAFRSFTEAYEAFRKENPPKPETRTVKVWINVNDFADGSALIGGAYTSKKEADNWSSRRRLACIEREITYTVGEGLDP